MVTVGLQGGGYIEDRCVLRIPMPDVNMVRVYDIVDIANIVSRRVFHASHATAFLSCIHQGRGFHHVDGFHLVNTLSFSRRPWITTYEHYLPRWNPRSRFGMNLIARKNCLAIIGLSSYARRSMDQLLEEHPDLRETIVAKIQVLHPPQAMLVSSYDEKPLDPEVPTFTFVGREFFRKGGMEILQTAAALRNEGHRFRIHIISDLECGDYVTKAGGREVAQARQMMAQLGDTILFRGALPNEEVLQTLRASHAALLPTFDDTYGFSVLEAQACGTPVITTDVCALNEINSEERGWLIALPQDRCGQAVTNGTADLAGLSRLIRDGLLHTMRNVLTDPGAVRSRGIRALETIAMRHDPGRHAETLVRMYRRFLPGR